MPTESPTPLTTLLSTLLSWAWIALTMETDNAFEAATAERVGRCVRISLPMWTNGLRHIDDEGVTVDQLRGLARARCNIGGLERWGWISVGDTGAGRRAGYGSHRGITGDTVLRPTRAGLYARRVWPTVVEGVEAHWRARFSDTVVENLRAALLDEPARVSGLPWSPPEINPSDGFRTHVEAAPIVETAPIFEPTAQDRPLAALLGQVLTDRTLQYEGPAPVSLPLAANVLRVVAGDTAQMRDLPRLSGLAKEAVAMAVGYLRRSGLAVVNPDRAISLTSTGLKALDWYWNQSNALADTKLREALEHLLTRMSAMSAGFTPPPGCWRAENPYLAQTRRLLADPTGSLPWHPMVLHRAGWPDGS